MASLNTDALSKVICTLEAGLGKLTHVDLDSIDYDLYRNAVVKSFELSLEISGKLIRKALKAFGDDPAYVDGLVFNDVLRQAGKRGLLTPLELERWFEYRKYRNRTAHDYGEKLADSVVTMLGDYAQDVSQLKQRMTKVFEADDR